MSNSSQGRAIVIALIVVTLTVDVAVIAITNLLRGDERLSTQMGRFFLTVGLCVYLYQGANWARWVAAVLFGLGGLAGLSGGLLLGPQHLGGILLLGMGLIYLVSACILVFVPSVRDFFTLD